MKLKAFLASLFFVGLLAGCGGNDKTAEDPNTDTATPTEEPVEEPTTNAGEDEARSKRRKNRC